MNTHPLETVDVNSDFSGRTDAGCIGTVGLRGCDDRLRRIGLQSGLGRFGATSVASTACDHQYKHDEDRGEFPDTTSPPATSAWLPRGFQEYLISVSLSAVGASL